MSLIKNDLINGPATHALVIGVGSYAHLNGGAGPLFPDHGGMGQLSSPPHSARAIANWLLNDYNNPTKPLASLELLISDPRTQSFTLTSGQIAQIDIATMVNVEAAIHGWFTRGDQNQDNLLIFYFCGHGIAKGFLISLLLQDFGQIRQNALRHSIDFNKFHLGMAQCSARQQCYFIDACRVASSTLIESDDYNGEPIIRPSVRVGPVLNPIYYSTLAGSQAFGQPGAPSIFTEALLSSLNGPGSSDVYGDGDWRVDTDTLNRGVDFLIDRRIAEFGKVDQVCSVSNLSRFTLHYLNRLPEVLVEVSCKPEQANQDANLSCSNGTKSYRRNTPALLPWNLMLETGDYDFRAEFNASHYRDNSKSDFVRPPFRPIKIEVQP